MCQSLMRFKVRDYFLNGAFVLLDCFEASLQFTSDTNPSSIYLHSSCVVSNLQLSIDLQAAGGLEMGHCLQPQHVHTDICHHCKHVWRRWPATAVRESALVWVHSPRMKSLTPMAD